MDSDAPLMARLRFPGGRSQDVHFDVALGQAFGKVAQKY
jgi:hypothetical protein